MLRIAAATAAAAPVAALPIAAAAKAEALRPKSGDIDRIGNGEACVAAGRRKMYLCRENTDFETNAKNRKYAGCLPIFRQQALRGAEHFTLAKSRCRGSVRMNALDRTGFGYAATAERSPRAKGERS